MGDKKRTELRCDCDFEVLEFTVYDTTKSPIYEFSFIDSFHTNTHSGLLGRLRRAVGAFKEKPVVYTGVMIENKQKVLDFLYKCISIIENIDE